MLIAFDAPPISSVEPSGGAFTTYSDAMLVMAPGRFSMMNCCLSISASRSISARVTMSVLPPAANGLTMRTTLPGDVCAWTLAENAAAMHPTTSGVCSFTSKPFEHRRALFAKSSFALLAILRGIVHLGPARFQFLRGGRRVPILRAHGFLDGAKTDGSAACHPRRYLRDFGVK